MKDKRTITALFALLLATVLATEVRAQSLDEAVNGQLAIVQDPIGRRVPCLTLLDGDPNSLGNLTGALLAICSRSASQSGDTPSASTGATAGSASSAPKSIRERMYDDESGEEEEQEREYGIFFTGEYQRLDRVASRFQDGYGSTVAGLTGGFDARLRNGTVLGAAITGSRQSGDFRSGGNFDVDSVGAYAFGAFTAGKSGFVNAYAGYREDSTDRLRIARFVDLDPVNGSELIAFEGAPESDIDSSQLSAGILAGYNIVFENVTLAPIVAFDISQTEFDTYSEVDDSGLALTFHDDQETSRLFSAGMEGTVAISTKWGVVVAQQNVMWRYETGRDQRNAEISFVDDTSARRFTYQTEIPDDEYLEYNFGLTFVLPSDVNLYINYSGLAAHRYFSNSLISAGFHKSF